MKVVCIIANAAAKTVVILGILLFVLKIQGISPYIVLSGSMEPKIPAGGLIFTDTRSREPRTGDIITYRIENETVTHRVIRREKDGFITKGDANDREDLAPVSEEQIMGTVLFSLPYLGYVFCGLQNAPPAYLILIMMILSFCLDINVFSKKNSLNRKESARESAR